MIVRKLRRKRDGFICYYPVDPWQRIYQIVDGERLSVHSEIYGDRLDDFEVLGEGEQDDMEEKSPA